ncbi:MAG: HEAT repeat domain-containing protein [Verrucomicrobiota bacterium]
MFLRSALPLLFLFSLVRLVAAEPRPPETVGTLDFFGLRRVTEAEVRAALQLKEGDRYDRKSAKSLTAAVEALPSVKKATISPVTIDGTGKLSVFIGVEEEGSVGFAFLAAPQGEQRLPEPLAQIYRDMIAALGPAVRKGTGGEDHSQGHALSKDPGLRQAQDAAVAQLKEQATRSLVQEVLRSSSNAEDRTAAAWLLGYAPDKQAIVADLVAAARDPDGSVRNNATRALGVLTDYAAEHPKLGIVIEPQVFLDLISSVTWTDRNKGSFLLSGLTKRPTGAALLRTLREQRLPELIEMARWKSKGHAYPSVLILGRIAGWDESATLRAAHEGNVEKLIAAAKAAK